MNCSNHTPQPQNYAEWHFWADNMSRTHRQVQCPECKLWAIWVPKLRVNPYDLETVHRANPKVPR